MTECEDGSSLIEKASSALTGIPEPLQNSAWKAVSRLIGGAAAVPAAWLRRVSQGVDDKTDGKSIVQRALAQAVAEQAVTDPELMERAKVHFLGDLARKQRNREQVAQITHDELKAETGEQPESEISDDWFNIFSRYVEDASTDRMQHLWGKILAGEVRRPGSFSLATMRFVAELDQELAVVFERISAARIGDCIWKKDARVEGQRFNDLSLLETSGLITGLDGNINRYMAFDERGLAFFVGEDHSLLVYGKPETRVAVPIYLYTRVGAEIASLKKQASEPQNLIDLSEWLRDQPSVNKITLAQTVISGGLVQSYSPVTLWERAATVGAV